jgi:hypothetical protein
MTLGAWALLVLLAFALLERGDHMARMCVRIPSVGAVLLLAASCYSGEGQAAPKKFDWSDAKTLKAYWEWVATKAPFPALVAKSNFDATTEEKGLAAVGMLEIPAPVLDGVKQGVLQAARAIGQMLAQGSPIYKVGIVVKSGEETAIVMLPAENLKKFGAETLKGEKSDKAVVKKMADLILNNSDWREVEKLVKKRGPATAK